MNDSRIRGGEGAAGSRGVRRTKGKREAQDKEGRDFKVPVFFYGYKAHTSMNVEAESITSVAVTAGNQTDGEQFPSLVKRDQGQKLPTKTYAGDRGYDDTENHYLLETEKLHSSLKLNKYRTEKKDKNKDVWGDLLASEGYQAGQRERYKIERKYGEPKVSTAGGDAATSAGCGFSPKPT